MYASVHSEAAQTDFTQPRADRVPGDVVLSSDSTRSPDRSSNHLLAALPDAEWQRWLPELQSVDMPLGQVLYESGTTLSHVYFPTTSIVSLLYVMENGSSAEIAVVGNEGIVGISLFMGGGSTPSRAVVQSAGEGLRLDARTLKNRVRPKTVRFCIYSCATRKLLSRRRPTLPYATANTLWINNYAAGCC